MCRLLAATPGMSKAEALTILDKMEWGNTRTANRDGFGYSYINNEGNFVTKKYALSFSTLINKKFPILNHMPHNGYTIIHMRAASCGGVRKENSHPFQIEDRWSICHNGYFKEHNIVRLALSKTTLFHGESDSEVAANLIDLIGPKKFALSDDIDFAGVYLCLKKDGTLEVIKSSGDLAMHIRENKSILISSELDILEYKQMEASRGWYKFDKDGKFIDFKKKEWKSYSSIGNLPLHSGVNYGGAHSVSMRDFSENWD